MTFREYLEHNNPCGDECSAGLARYLDRYEAMEYVSRLLVSRYMHREDESTQRCLACNEYGTHGRGCLVGQAVEALDLSTEKPKPEVVELVVDEYFEILGVYPLGLTPERWYPAKCVELGKENASAPCFEFTDDRGNVVQGRRVEGEYRNPTTKETNQ